MASIWDVVTGKASRKDTSATARAESKQAAEDARLKRETESEARAQAERDAAKKKVDAIQFKRGGVVKVKSVNKNSSFKW